MGSSQRVLLTVVICVGIIVAWQYLLGPKPGQQGPGSPPAAGQQSPDVKQAEVNKPGMDKAGPDGGTAAAGGTPRVEQPPLPAGSGPRSSTKEGIHTRLDVEDAVALFTDRGAALRSWKLKNPRFQQTDVKSGKLVPVDLVSTPAGQGPWPLVTSFPKSDFELPEDARFKLVSKSSTEVVYAWQSEVARVTKHYVLDRKRPLVWLTLSVKNLGVKKLNQRLELSLFNRQDPDQSKPGFTNPYPRIPTVGCHVNGEYQFRSAGAITGEESGCSAGGCGMGEGPVNQTGEVLWIGSGDRYFLTAVVPKDKPSERRCELRVLDGGIIQSSLLYPEQTVAPDKEIHWKFAVFVGAKELGDLDSVKGPSGGEVKLSEAIEFGWFAVICRPMLWLLKLFFSWFGNWGVAIILLTLVVKGLTLYWTQKSMRSMKAMQRLKPKMDLLREKYGDDKQRLNQEMMNLYKVHKVNPLGGCLPMVIQMPIWFALYRTLGNAVELYRSSFAGWITDLTAPDPYYVLPIAMGVAMYGQQAITPQPLEGAQAKMMKYFMPGMFTVMMLALPSGLTLYIFVNTVLTMLHQWYMNKTDPGAGVPDPTTKAPSVEVTSVERERRRRIQESGGSMPGPAKGRQKVKSRRRKKTDK